MDGVLLKLEGGTNYPVVSPTLSLTLVVSGTSSIFYKLFIDVFLSLLIRRLMVILSQLYEPCSIQNTIMNFLYSLSEIEI